MKAIRNLVILTSFFIASLICIGGMLAPSAMAGSMAPFFLNYQYVNSMLTTKAMNPSLSGNSNCGSGTCIASYFSEVLHPESATWNMTNTIRVQCMDTYQGASDSYYIQTVCVDGTSIIGDEKVLLDVLNGGYVNSMLTTKSASPSLSGDSFCGSGTCVAAYFSDVLNPQDASYTLTNTIAATCQETYNGPSSNYYIQAACIDQSSLNSNLKSFLSSLNSASVNSMLTTKSVNPSLSGNANCGSNVCIANYFYDVADPGVAAFSVSNPLKTGCSETYHGSSSSYYIQTACIAPTSHAANCICPKGYIWYGNYEYCMSTTSPVAPSVDCKVTSSCTQNANNIVIGYVDGTSDTFSDYCGQGNSGDYGPFHYVCTTVNGNLPSYYTTMTPCANCVNGACVQGGHSVVITAQSPRDRSPRNWSIYTSDPTMRHIGAGRLSIGSPILSESKSSGDSWSVRLNDGTYYLIIALSSNSNYGRYSGSIAVDGTSSRFADADMSHPIRFTVGQVNCTPSWRCTDWSRCIGGSQARACKDVNGCASDTGKPLQTQSCKAKYGCCDIICNGKSCSRTPDNSNCQSGQCSNSCWCSARTVNGTNGVRGLGYSDAINSLLDYIRTKIHGLSVLFNPLA